MSLALPDLTTEEKGRGRVATVHDEFCLECRQGRKVGQGRQAASSQQVRTRLEREQEAS